MGQLHIERRDACSALGRDPKDTLAFLEAVLPVLPVLHVLPVLPVLWVVSVLVLGSCARPEGIALDRPADGRIDDLERAALVEAARAGLRPAQDDPILLGLWNDFRVARRDWLAPLGIDPRQNGLHLRLYETAEESSTRHLELFGHDQPHFFRHSTRTIYSFSDALPDTWSMLLHEAGHDLGTPELAAEANRLHGLIFTLCLDPAVGTALVFPGSDGRRSPLLTRWMPDPWTPLSEVGAYGRAVLIFLREAMMHADTLDVVFRDLAAMDEDAVRAYPSINFDVGIDARFFWLESFLGFFENSALGAYLLSIVEKRGGDPEVARQLLVYLRIALNDLRLPLYDTTPYIRQVAQMDTLLDRTVAHGVFYPDMQNRIAEVLGLYYSSEAEDATPLGQVEAYARVLVAHAHLPCEADPWACPEPFTSVRPRHLEAYQGLVAAQAALEDPVGILGTVEEFLARFYPGGDLSRPDTLGTLFVLLRAGIVSALLIVEPCEALDYAERYDRVACYSQPDPAECAADHPFDWETEEAIRRDELEELRASCTLAGR